MGKRTITKNSRKQEAYDRLLHCLLSGELKPGDSLDRRGVARLLGMSTAPVHEAMLQLQHEGLLETLPRRGTRIRPVGHEDVRGQLILREALESHALALARLNATDLEELLPLAHKADAARTLFSSAAAEVDFHVALVARAECAALLLEYRRIMQLGFFYRISFFMAPDPDGPLHSNVQLLHNLLGASPRKRQALISRHIWAGKEELESARTRP